MKNLSKEMCIIFDPEVPYTLLFDEIFDKVLDILDGYGIEGKYMATLHEKDDDRGYNGITGGIG